MEGEQKRVIGRTERQKDRAQERRRGKLRERRPCLGARPCEQRGFALGPGQSTEVMFDEPYLQIIDQHLVRLAALIEKRRAQDLMTIAQAV
jgi:hypothetical protein